MCFISFQIVGTGRAVPEYLLTNEQLSRMVDTSDEWIQSRTGIQSRHICTTESLTDLAALSAERALLKAGLAASELDMIICATLQGDFVTPSLACEVQKSIGATCPCFDLNAACTGFIYGLEVAAGLFAAMKVRKVLLIGAECISKHVDWNDRSTCVLFGDGAGAVVLAEGENLLAGKLTAMGNNELLTIPGAPGSFPQTPENPKRQALYMNGQEIYRFAVNAICQDIQEVLDEAKVSVQDIRYFLLHQANQRILDAARVRMHVDEEKVPSIIGQYGNMSAASIPVLLDELHRAGKLQRGDLLALCAFGGGLTTGAAVIRW